MPVRIYEISKKLGIESKEVLAKAKELGIAGARVASSTLDKITAEYLEQQIVAARPELLAPKAPPPPPEPEAAPAPVPEAAPTPAAAQTPAEPAAVAEAAPPAAELSPAAAVPVAEAAPELAKDTGVRPAQPAERLRSFKAPLPWQSRREPHPRLRQRPWRRSLP
jgi:translation initiation factor IF-2